MALWPIFLAVFFAELGDKTQLRRFRLPQIPRSVKCVCKFPCQGDTSERELLAII